MAEYFIFGRVKALKWHSFQEVDIHFPVIFGWPDEGIFSKQIKSAINRTKRAAIPESLFIIDQIPAVPSPIFSTAKVLY